MRRRCEEGPIVRGECEVGAKGMQRGCEGDAKGVRRGMRRRSKGGRGMRRGMLRLRREMQRRLLRVMRRRSVISQPLRNHLRIPVAHSLHPPSLSLSQPLRIPLRIPFVLLDLLRTFFAPSSHPLRITFAKFRRILPS